MAQHVFGGPWTELKLDAVEYYLECYTKALTAARLDLWYIDAFSGSGDRESTRTVGGLFEQRPVETITETLDGSVKRALAISPPFAHLRFIEKNPEFAQQLLRLKAQHADRDIGVLVGDANEQLLSLISRPPWTSVGGKARGVVFLDPYALHVDWVTLEKLAQTQLLDVWYLFPIRDVTRQLALRMSRIGPKEARLDKLLGEAWRELYSRPTPETDKQQLLFDDQSPEERNRVADWRQIEAWFKRRMEILFPYVSDPLPILHDRGSQTFSLFLAVSNPGKPAIDLASRFMGYVNKHYAPASRQKSAPSRGVRSSSYRRPPTA